MGSYHGKASFDAFTHRKPVLRKLRWWWDFGLISDLFLQYPPFSNFTEKAFEFLLRYAP